jgi:gamma-D-glutamyl-L-lysine dipeptidyl-peptidase
MGRGYADSRKGTRMIRFWLVLSLVLAGAYIAFADDVDLPTAEEFSVPKVVERLARRIEPGLAGKPDRLPQYVDFFRSELGNDSRLCAFHVTAKVVDGDRVELRGYTEFPETRSTLVKFLKVLGFKVDDRMEALPDAELGKEIFGLVKSPHSICYDVPSGRQRPENDCLIGEPLYLLREEKGHLLVHSGEGYLGYVRSKDVLRVDAAGFAKYLAGKRVRIKSDQKSGELTIPAGASLKWNSSDDQTVTVELPTDQHVTLPAASCELHRDTAADIDKVIAKGKQVLGTHYLWGGKTSEGIDCSGLVQSSYLTVGVHLPRDAYQQFYVGQLSATRWHTAGLRRGDTLYFLGPDGKIRHTGIYLGDDHYMHAVLPVARINSFNPADKDYDAKRHDAFAFAKRPVD